MEAVAEALKRLQVNGEWNFDLSDFLDKIRTNVYDHSGLYFSETDVMATLDAIVEIYGKKSPAIEWHDRTDSGLLLPPQKFDWEHDITGDLYDNMYFLEKRFPEHASKWTDGIFGGNCFKVGDEKFFTTEATRGIGYTALIAFDQFGNGAVFVKDKL